MNIQIFGRKKGHEVQKATRFFKERGIKSQFIDLDLKAISRRELEGVLRHYAVDELVDPACKDKALMAQFECLSPARHVDFLLENQTLLRSPIVRNGSLATIGVREDIWKQWLNVK